MITMILQQFKVDKKTNCNHDTKYTNVHKQTKNMNEHTFDPSSKTRSVVSHLLNENGSAFLVSFATCFSVILLKLITLM
jgi:hypothetical protein